MTAHRHAKLFTVVLTGGIASGKSTAAEYFSGFGVPVIDTDIIAREVVKPGTRGLQDIVNTFGDQILDDEQQLDRRKLRKIIFSDAGQREQLEMILHPLIEASAMEKIRKLEQQQPDYVIVAVPLYAETRTFRWVDRVLLIDVSRAVQLSRLQTRDNINLTLAERMLDAQASRQSRIDLADDIILNESSLKDLHSACINMHRKYLALAENHYGKQQAARPS